MTETQRAIEAEAFDYAKSLYRYAKDADIKESSQYDAYIAGRSASDEAKDGRIRELTNEIDRIKKHFAKVCSENKKKYSDNAAILIFIQKMEESITWVNQTTSK